MFLPTDATHLCNEISKVVQLETDDVPIKNEHVCRYQTKATSCATIGVVVPTDDNFCATTKKCRKLISKAYVQLPRN